LATFFHAFYYLLSPFLILFSRKIPRARANEHVPFTIQKSESSKDRKRWLQQTQVSKRFKENYKNFMKRNKVKNIKPKEIGLQKTK